MTFCHPKKVKLKRTQKGTTTEVTLSFSDEQAGWLKGASDIYTSGCIDKLVSDCFWDGFQVLSEEVAASLKKSNEEKN